MKDKYLARVEVTRNGVFQEDIWFENVRAKTQEIAEALVKEQATIYVTRQQGNKFPPTAAKVQWVCLMSEIDAQKYMPQKQAGVVPSSGKLLPPPARINPLDKLCELFTSEDRGDFKAPYKFKAEVKLPTGVSTNYYGGSTWPHNRRK